MRILLETIAIYLPSVYYVVLFLMTMGSVLESKQKVSKWVFIWFGLFMFMFPLMISICVINGFHCGIMSLCMIGLLALVNVKVSRFNTKRAELIFILGNLIYLAYLLGTSLK